MACKHWNEMAMLAEDAAEHDAEWIRENWQLSTGGHVWWTLQTAKESGWFDYVTHDGLPAWHDSTEYRRRPKLITATDAKGRVWSWPEPMREAPERGTYYFLLDMLGDGYAKFRWDNHQSDKDFLLRSLCHLTEEAIKQHAAAMRAICNGGEV